MSSSRGLARYLAAGALGIAVYFLLPPPVENVVFVASNLAAAAVILLQVRKARLRPLGGWFLLAAFPLATAVGNAVYFVNDSLRHVSPFPSFGDVAFLGGYVVLASGLLRLQQARSVQLDVPAMLDTAIITIGFAAASWVVFMAPLLHDSATPMLERLTALGYPVADVLVLAVAARFLLTTHRRSPAYVWLAGTVLVMLVADTTFAVLNLLGEYHTGHPVDALILTYNLGWGAVALHPHANDLAVVGTGRTGRTGRVSWPRLAALGAASLTAPIVLILQVTTGHPQDLIVTSSAAAVLFLLAVARMAGLVVQLEKVLEERHGLQTELSYRATHDELTGLANRREFTDRLERALKDNAAGGSTVLFLDLDRFKAVNDSLGHGAGDTLLTIVAARLRAELRAEDTLARIGGDEFAVLLADPFPQPEHLDSVITRMRATVREPARLAGLDVHVGVSIGTATARAGDTLEGLVHAADLGMYAAKTNAPRRTRTASVST